MGSVTPTEGRMWQSKTGRWYRDRVRGGCMICRDRVKKDSKGQPFKQSPYAWIESCKAWLCASCTDGYYSSYAKHFTRKQEKKTKASGAITKGYASSMGET